MNTPTISKHRSPVNCSKPGCSTPSNGIGPFNYCRTHYRSYVEWLARRTRLQAHIEVCIKQIDQSAALPQEDVDAFAEVGVPLALVQHEREQVLVGAVMDQIGHHATRSVFRSRPNSTPKENET